MLQNNPCVHVLIVELVKPRDPGDKEQGKIGYGVEEKLCINRSYWR